MTKPDPISQAGKTNPSFTTNKQSSKPLDPKSAETAGSKQSLIDLGKLQTAIKSTAEQTKKQTPKKEVSAPQTDSVRFSTRNVNSEFEQFSADLVEEALKKLAGGELKNVSEINDFLRVKRREYALRNGIGYEVIKNVTFAGMDSKNEKIILRAINNSGQKQEYIIQGSDYWRAFMAINKVSFADLQDTSRVFSEIKIPTTPNVLLEYGLPRGNMIMNNEIVPMELANDYMKTLIDDEFVSYQQPAQALLDKKAKLGSANWQKISSFKVPGQGNHPVSIQTRLYTHREIIDGEEVELTTTSELKADGKSQLTWKHTSVDNAKRLQPLIETRYQKATDLNLDFAQRLKSLAEMVYLSFQQCGDARGSATRSDWLMEIAARQGNIKLSGWKPGVLPDCEALTSDSMEAFVNDFIAGKFSKSKPQPAKLIAE